MQALKLLFKKIVFLFKREQYFVDTLCTYN